MATIWGKLLRDLSIKLYWCFEGALVLIGYPIYWPSNSDKYILQTPQGMRSRRVICIQPLQLKGSVIFNSASNESRRRVFNSCCHNSSKYLPKTKQKLNRDLIRNRSEVGRQKVIFLNMSHICHVVLPPKKSILFHIWLYLNTEKSLWIHLSEGWCWSSRISFF